MPLLSPPPPERSRSEKADVSGKQRSWDIFSEETLKSWQAMEVRPFLRRLLHIPGLPRRDSGAVYI